MHREAAPPLPDWLDRLLPVGLDRYRVRVDDLAIHVMEAGEGLPVFMLHGNPTWGFLWRHVAQRLMGRPLRLIMPDLPGLGWSDRVPASEHTLDNHARWMAGLLDELSLDRLIFVCQDWGGAIGACALAYRPERLAGLVVLNTVLGPPRPGFSPTAFHRLSQTPLVSDLAFRVGGVPQRMLHRAQGDRSTMRGQVARAYRAPLGRFPTAPLALARMVPDSHDHPSIPQLERAQRLIESFHGPAEIVWGDRDPILGWALSRVQRQLPQAGVTRTQAGHFLQEEVPDEIAAAIVRVADALTEVSDT